MTTAWINSKRFDDAADERHSDTDAERTGEVALIERARTDPDAFEMLYRRHYPAVVGYLYRRTGDEASAEDLAAETFLAAYKAIGRFEQRGIPLRAWLLRIATNQANARDRRRKARERMMRGLRLLHKHEPSERPRDEMELLHAAMDRLAPAHRTVLALVHFEGLPLETAARVLGVPEGTVKSRVTRARAALRSQLERMGVTP